jgi:hypothetical protein
MSTSRQRDNSSLAILAGSLIIMVYALVYLLDPFSHFFNQLILGTLTLVASALVSVYATLIFRLLLPGDAPRAVWKNFAIGFWLWTIAEFFWLLRGLSIGNVGGTASGLTISHLFWFVAYVFFSIALYRQHRIIATARRARGIWVVFAIWGGVIVASVLTNWGMDGSLDFLPFLQYFFGLADLAVGIVGLSMLMAFRGGALAWPWWGFLGLAVSNIAYEALDASMMASASTTTIFILEMFSELIYLAAYLVLVFGFYKQYLLLRYGPPVGEPATRPRGPETR